jgi:WXXGXW repeat (2 copies)
MFRRVAGGQEEASMKLESLRGVLAAALTCVALSACVVAPAPGYYYSGETVYTAPPAAQYEAVGVAPAPGYFWIGGGWFWEGGRYVWHGGHWAAPRPGYHWVPRTWVRVNGGWRVHGGVWVVG